MTRYTIRAAKKVRGCDECDCDDVIDFGVPEVPESVATDTGLVDAHGNTIWRTPDPIGFDFWGPAE